MWNDCKRCHNNHMLDDGQLESVGSTTAQMQETNVPAPVSRSPCIQSQAGWSRCLPSIKYVFQSSFRWQFVCRIWVCSGKSSMLELWFRYYFLEGQLSLITGSPSVKLLLSIWFAAQIICQWFAFSWLNIGSLLILYGYVVSLLLVPQFVLCYWFMINSLFVQYRFRFTAGSWLPHFQSTVDVVLIYYWCIARLSFVCLYFPLIVQQLRTRIKPTLHQYWHKTEWT